MGLSAVTYALAKKYTDNTVIGLGGIKGAPCKVKSVVKTDGRSVITLEWKGDDGTTQTSEVYVNDGISVWISGRQYAINDIVVKDDTLYICKIPNSDVNFDDSKWAIVVSGGSSDVKIRELTKAEYDALTPAEKMNGTIYFVTDEQGGGGGGGSAELTADMTVVKAVGGITIGTEYYEGTTLEKILRDMLSPVLYPTLTNPSASISATGSKLLEKGGSLNTTVTVTFNRGSINPAYGTSGYRSGPATGYSLNGGTEQAGNTFAITVTESVNNTLNANVVYSAGEQPKDSTGQNYSTPLPAGNVNSNTISYEFVNAFWANTTSAGTIEKQSLVSKSTKVKAFSFPATTATDPECFDVPADYTVTAVEVLNTLSGQWENAISQFDISNVNHDDAGGTSTAYKRYSCNLGMSLGARQVRVKWS